MSNPLIAAPPSPASPANATVAGNAWWPSIDRNAARDALRLGEIVTDARLTAALEGAWLTITSDLAEWQAALALGWPNATPPVPGPDSLAHVTAAQLLALCGRPDGRPYWATWNDAERQANGWGCNPFAYHRPQYTPARAAWLCGTMTDSVTGNAVPNLVTLFVQAVRFSAAAELVELYRDMGMQAKADARAEAMLSTGADYRRMAIEKVRDMLGVSRITSELI
jgi:hypothetical protein